MTDTEPTNTGHPTSRRGEITLVNLAVVVALGLMTLVGCSSSSEKSVPRAATDTADTMAPAMVVNGTKTTIGAEDNVFVPAHLQIKVNTQVTFTNVGHNKHDVTATDPSKFNFSIVQAKFNPGESATFAFAKPGTYFYYCSLHATATAGSMRGVVTVTR